MKDKVSVKTPGRTFEVDVPELLFDDPEMGIMNLGKLADTANDMARAVRHLRVLQKEDHDAALAVASVLEEASMLLSDELGKIALEELARTSKG